jgi:hypothetical protein
MRDDEIPDPRFTIPLVFFVFEPQRFAQSGRKNYYWLALAQNLAFPRKPSGIAKPDSQRAP